VTGPHEPPARPAEPTPPAPAAALPWQPPSTPPQAPPRAPGPVPEPLTAVPWSLPVAALFVAAIVAVTLGAAGLSALARSLGLTGSALTLTIGALLSAGYLLVLGCVWWVARRRGVTFADAVGMRPASGAAFAGGVLLAVVVGRLAAGAWGIALQYLDVPGSPQDVDPSRLFPATPAGILVAFLVAVVLAPLAEEVLFRGVLLSALSRRWGTAVAVFGSSAVFSAMHVSPIAVPPIFVLALVLGWLFVRTRSLTVCIVAHSVFNGFGLAALYALKAAGYL